MKGDIRKFSISYGMIPTSSTKPGYYKQAMAGMPGRVLSLLNRNEVKSFEFLKQHNTDYVLNPYFLNVRPSENGPIIDALVEDAMPYEAWLDLLLRGRLDDPKFSDAQKWEIVKKHLQGFFRELILSLLKAHENGFKIHEDTDIFLCVYFDKNNDCNVRKCKFTYLDRPAGGPFNFDATWFWNKLEEFLREVGCCWHLAPNCLTDFVSTGVFHFNDCAYFWTNTRKAEFIFQFAQCILENCLDRHTLSVAMRKYGLTSWMDTLRAADRIRFGGLQLLLVEPRFGSRLTRVGSNRLVKDNNLQYGDTSDLIMFFRDALNHFYDNTMYVQQPFAYEREEIVEIIETLFEDLTFKLWLALGDYYDLPRDPHRDDDNKDEIEKIVFAIGLH